MAPERGIYFVAGLPRSGSTLLVNLLGQNPRFHVTPTSGILDVLVTIRNNWRMNEAFRALPSDESERIEIQVLCHSFRGYFAHVEKPVAFDKNRAWLEFLELAALLVGGESRLKVLVTVRDLRDVLASFEVLYRKTAATGRIPQEQANELRMKTALGRIAVFIDDAQPVGRCYNAIRDAVTRGWRERMHFIDYEDLTRDPARALADIYEFLGEPLHKHDFQNVRQLTFEDDSAYGFKDLHKIRPRIEPAGPRWPEIYDPAVTTSDVWKNVEKVAQFWRAYTGKKS